MIPYTHDCGKKFNIKDEFAGRRVKCPGCGQPFEVPPVAEDIPEADLVEEPLPAEVPVGKLVEEPAAAQPKPRPRPGAKRPGRRPTRYPGPRTETMHDLEQRAILRALVFGGLLVLIFLMPVAASYRGYGLGNAEKTYHFSWDLLKDMGRMGDLAIFAMIFFFFPVLAGGLMFGALKIGSGKGKAIAFLVVTAIGVFGVFGVMTMGFMGGFGMVGRGSPMGAVLLVVAMIFSFIYANAMQRVRIDIPSEGAPRVGGIVAGALLVIICFIPIGSESLIGGAVNAVSREPSVLLLLIIPLVGVFAVIGGFLDASPAKVLAWISVVASAVLGTGIWLLMATRKGGDVLIGTALIGRVVLILYLFYWAIYYLQRAHFMQKNDPATAGGPVLRGRGKPPTGRFKVPGSGKPKTRFKRPSR